MPKQRRKRRPPKRSLAIPDLEQTKSAVLNGLTSKSGQRTYDHAINEFVDWYCSEPRLAFNRTVVLRYRIHLEQRHLAPTTINLRLAAIKRVAYAAAGSGLFSPELAAGIRRVKGVRRIGVRLGNWLTADQGRSLLLNYHGDSLRSKRNYAILALLIGCRLRRGELLGTHPNRTDPTLGKGSLDRWSEASGIKDGYLFLAGGELDQIQFLLGHVSIQTTEHYLGCKQKLRFAVNDKIGIEP